MAELKRAANGYDYYQAVPSTSEWDIIPEPRHKERPTERTRERVEVDYQVHPAMVAKRRNALKNCLVIMVCFVMLSVVLMGYAAISKINLENIQIQSNIDNLESQVDRLSVDIASKSEITNLANKAETELQMSFPAESQIRYIKIAEPGKTVQSNQAAEKEGFFEMLWQTMKSIFE